MKFSIGDVVDEPSLDLPVYGKVIDLTETKAKVVFRIPRREKKKGFCDACGSPAHLSINGETGELVCLVTGCGHEYGFEKKTRTIPLEKLVNITEQKIGQK